MDFNELVKYVLKRKNKRLQANYQPIVIKALIENGGSLKKSKILEIIQKYNPELPFEKVIEIPVFKVLKKGVNINQENDSMSLTFENYTKDQEIQLVKFCNEWIYNVNIRKEIDQLESVGVSYVDKQSIFPQQN